jgi:hypothetical protein
VGVTFKAPALTVGVKL